MAKGQVKQKKTEENLQKFMKCLEEGLTRESACGMIWISRSTMYYRAADDKDFLTNMEKAEDFWMWLVEKSKKQKIDEGYRPAIERELKSKRRKVYGDKVENTNINLDKDVSNMTDEELTTFIQNNS